MIAIPARTRDGQLLLTTIFGRCEQVALIDENDRIEVRENPFDGGVDLAKWLLENGVDTVVMRNMGANPYLTLRQAGARVYATPRNRAPISEIVADLRSGGLVEVTPENMGDHLKPSRHRHQHEGNHGHEGTGHSHPGD